jgi:hypothetical protein
LPPTEAKYPKDSILELVQQVGYNRFNFINGDFIKIHVNKSLYTKLLKPTICGYKYNMFTMDLDFNVLKNDYTGRQYIYDKFRSHNNYMLCICKKTKFDLENLNIKFHLCHNTDCNYYYVQCRLFSYPCNYLNSYKEEIFNFNIVRCNVYYSAVKLFWNFDIENSILDREEEKGEILCQGTLFQIASGYRDFKLTRFKSQKFRAEYLSYNKWKKIPLERWYNNYLINTKEKLIKNMDKDLTPELEKEIKLQIAVEKL